MKKINSNLEKKIIKEIKKIINSDIKPNLKFQKRYDSDEVVSFCISFFDHWLTDDEMEDIVMFFEDEDADDNFYNLYFKFENKVIKFLSDIYQKKDVFVFSDHGDNSAIYQFNDQEDLECVTKLILRADLLPIKIYIRSYKTIFSAQTDLTWQAVSFNGKKLKKEISKYDINILE
jgi:hypothetical protein